MFMNTTILQSEMPAGSGEQLANGSIGDIIRQTNNLTAEQVESIVAYQAQHGVKFGEAAVALGFVKEDDVLWALAQQFHYPYSNQTTNSIASELVVATRPFCDQAEMFRAMRSQLLSTVFTQGGARAALAVISPETGDGKSYFAANMAVAFSQLGGAHFADRRRHAIASAASDLFREEHSWPERHSFWPQPHAHHSLGARIAQPSRAAGGGGAAEPVGVAGASDFRPDVA